LLFRKGGIKEPVFKPEARRFLCFPTQFHTDGQLLKTGVAERYAAALQLDPKAQTSLLLPYAAELTGAWTTQDASIFSATDGLHVLTNQVRRQLVDNGGHKHGAAAQLAAPRPEPKGSRSVRPCLCAFDRVRLWQGDGRGLGCCGRGLGCCSVCARRWSTCGSGQRSGLGSWVMFCSRLALQFGDIRLKWRAKQPLTVLELRVWRLEQPFVLPVTEDLFGCFSWRESPTAPRTHVPRPNESAHALRLICPRRVFHSRAALLRCSREHTV
jgi:hypothetical protein